MGKGEIVGMVVFLLLLPVGYGLATPVMGIATGVAIAMAKDASGWGAMLLPSAVFGLGMVGGCAALVVLPMLGSRAAYKAVSGRRK